MLQQTSMSVKLTTGNASRSVLTLEARLVVPVMKLISWKVTENIAAEVRCYVIISEKKSTQ